MTDIADTATAQDQLINLQSPDTQRLYELYMEQLIYSSRLAQAIEMHCAGQFISNEFLHQAPHLSAMMNNRLSQISILTGNVPPQSSDPIKAQTSQAVDILNCLGLHGASDLLKGHIELS